MGQAAQWRNGLPEGVIHWTGWQKPWHSGTSLWRPDLWAAEETSWEELRNGWWEKPRAAVVESVKGRESLSLTRRGWKVDFYPVQGVRMEEEEEAGLSGERSLSNLEEPSVTSDVVSGSFPPPFPSLVAHSPLETGQILKGAMEELPVGLEFVRFGPGIRAADFLKNQKTVQGTVVLQGPVAVEEIRRLRKAGYQWEARIIRSNWPEGGPAPSLLDFVRHRRSAKAGPEEDVYLKRDSRHPRNRSDTPARVDDGHGFLQ